MISGGCRWENSVYTERLSGYTLDTQNMMQLEQNDIICNSYFSSP